MSAVSRGYTAGQPVRGEAVIEETIQEGPESDGSPLVPAAREALMRTGGWASWAGVFMGGGAVVTLLSGALMFWHMEQAADTLNNFHAAPGSRAANLVTRYLLELRSEQVFISGSMVLGAVLGALMGWLALRFGIRLMRIRYSRNREALTAAAQAQRTFWRTQGVFFICAMALYFVAVVSMGVYLASHMHH